MIDHLRAVFILLHVVAIGILCIPAPVGAINERTYNNKGVQAIFAEYAQALQGVGVSISRAELQDLAWEAGQGLLDTRKALVRPFRRYYALTGTAQGWRMFGMVNRKPARLELHVQQRPGGPWEPLYIMRDPAHAWRSTQLNQERVRGLLNDFSHLRSKRRYKRTVRWFAAQVAQEQPDAWRLRASMVVLPSPTPAALRAQGSVTPGKRVWVETVTLADLEEQAP